MTPPIISPTTQPDLSAFYLMDPVPSTAGSYFTKLQHKSGPVYIQAPSCSAKQGFSKTTKRSHVDLYFDHTKKEFIDWIVDIETRCQEQLYDRSGDWFQNPLDYQEIESVFHSCIKLNKKGGYTVRANIKSNAMTNESLVTVYDESQNLSTMNEVTNDKEILAILEVTGVKFTSRSFALDVDVRQVMVLNNDTFSKCLIKPSNSSVKQGGGEKISIPKPSLGSDSPTDQEPHLVDTSPEMITGDTGEIGLSVVNLAKEGDENEIDNEDDMDRNVRFDMDGIGEQYSDGDKIQISDDTASIDAEEIGDSLLNNVAISSYRDTLSGENHHEYSENHENDEDDEGDEDEDEDEDEDDDEDEEEDEEDDEEEEEEEDDYFIPTAKLAFGGDVKLDHLDNLDNHAFDDIMIQKDGVGNNDDIDHPIPEIDDTATQIPEHSGEDLDGLDILAKKIQTALHTPPTSDNIDSTVSLVGSAETETDVHIPAVDDRERGKLVDDILNDIQEKREGDTIEEVDLDIPATSAEDTDMQLKPRNEHYYELYKEARQMARDSKQQALESYMNAKNIKKRYLLDTPNDSSDDSDFSEDDLSVDNFEEATTSSVK